LDAGGMARFVGIVDRALMERPPELRRQLGTLLGFIRWLPLLRWGTSFERLSGPQKDRVLRWVQDAPVTRLRAGFWGLKTLVFMGYYGQPEVWPTLPYEPRFDGNEALHA
ncbi:MAG: hypothetical protein GXP47_13655, partial [Acidobacteria bacterium]|nr:hypothetical protein [Acidobacteriota bacterium]